MFAAATVSLTDVSAAIAAIGALGTASFGLVDTFKMLPGGGISLSGFKFVHAAMRKLAPNVAQFNGTELSLDSMLYALRSQWINGAATSDQVSIAKSLVKLRLIPQTSTALAQATGVDAAVLSAIATNIVSGQALTAQENDVYGRFDLLLTTMLDQAYQRADQRYRNAAKATALLVSVVLALVAAHFSNNLVNPGTAVVLGLLATPLAPIAKDLATGLTTAMQAIQSLKS